MLVMYDEGVYIVFAKIPHYASMESNIWSNASLSRMTVHLAPSWFYL